MSSEPARVAIHKRTTPCNVAKAVTDNALIAPVKERAQNPRFIDPRDESSSDGANAKCAVFGIVNDPYDAACRVYYGLHALQHRGQESAGICSMESSTFQRSTTMARSRGISPIRSPKSIKKGGSRTHSKMHVYKQFGRVLEVFNDSYVFDDLPGDMAIGHTRYSTSGSDSLPENIQPFTTVFQNGNLAMVHNGNITNFRKIHKRLLEKGTLFKTTSDSELVLHLIAQSSGETIQDRVIEACSQLEGAFSFILMTSDRMFAVRDPNGFRPLVFGRIEACGGMAYVLASETCGFDIIGAEYLREIEPGEVLMLTTKACKSGGNFQSFKLPQKFGTSQCVFEYIYFSRPDSILFGRSVDAVRKSTGAQLAHEHPVGQEITEGEGEGDEKDSVLVFAVPDSSNVAALGYAEELKRMGRNATFGFGLIRNHYVGRTFIAPSQDARELKVRCKFNTVTKNIEGREVVMVDDSIVRGTTSKQLVKMVRRAGAKKVHFRVASPAVRNPCFYGMDFPSREELLANKCSEVNGIAEQIGADTVGYLSVDGLMKAVRRVGEENNRDFCKACFNGDYPVPPPTTNSW